MPSKPPENATLIILETEWFGGATNKFVEVHHYEVEARATGKSWVFHYGDGKVRKIVPRFDRERRPTLDGTTKGRGLHALVSLENKPRDEWHISYSPSTANRAAKRYYAFTQSGFLKRIRRPKI